MASKRLMVWFSRHPAWHVWVAAALLLAMYTRPWNAVPESVASSDPVANTYVEMNKTLDSIEKRMLDTAVSQRQMIEDREARRQSSDKYEEALILLKMREGRLNSPRQIQRMPTLGGSVWSTSDNAEPPVHLVSSVVEVTPVIPAAVFMATPVYTPGFGVFTQPSIVRRSAFSRTVVRVR